MQQLLLWLLVLALAYGAVWLRLNGSPTWMADWAWTGVVGLALAVFAQGLQSRWAKTTGDKERRQAFTSADHSFAAVLDSIDTVLCFSLDDVQPRMWRRTLSRDLGNEVLPLLEHSGVVAQLRSLAALPGLARDDVKHLNRASQAVSVLLVRAKHYHGIVKENSGEWILGSMAFYLRGAIWNLAQTEAHPFEWTRYRTLEVFRQVAQIAWQIKAKGTWEILPLEAQQAAATAESVIESSGWSLNERRDWGGLTTPPEGMFQTIRITRTR